MTHIGHVILVVALAVVFFSAVAAFAGARISSRRLINGARYSVIMTAGLYTLAVAVILYAFVTKDFSLKIVSDHASKDLPALYSLSALYADKAGSLFFWGWLISLFTALLSLQQRGITNQRALGYAVFVLGIIQVFFLVLVTFAANVFERSPIVPSDGLGLNPLLQNVGMLIHPPLLYIGFSGFAVVFALAIAFLIMRSPVSEWPGTVMRWAVFAWCMLGVGNVVGMWWSYNELGWGGYWAWDPVENAGLMPWLLATAFLHSVVIAKKKNYLHVWTYVLVVITFVFTLLSPFITHGGIESPLHGFYGSNFPPYILAAMLITLLCSLVLIAVRRHVLKSEKTPLSLMSREGAFLITNLLIVALVVCIFLGTVLPKVVESMGGAKIAIDRTFFDRTCGPILLILVFFMGVCPLLGRGKSFWNTIKSNFLYSILATLIIIVILLIFNPASWYVAVLIGLACFPLTTIIFEWVRGTMAGHRNRSENYVKAFLNLFCKSTARYGGLLVHIGVIMIALGVIVSSFYSHEGTETLNPGESMQVGKYQFQYEELILKQDSMKVSAIASLSVIENGRLVTSLEPSYDYWFKHKNSFAEVAVRSTPVRDIFVSLVWTDYNPNDKSATFRVLVNPMILWIWVGGGFFLLGGALAFSAQRRKQSTEE
jgi:cytochrome c-type biogenesis protein CcmF